MVLSLFCWVCMLIFSHFFFILLSSDAPKQTNITRAAEQQQPEGKRSVTLSCSSDGYPEVTDYSWYRKTKDGEEDVKVFAGQKYTVSSDQPGHYYCVGKNYINQRSSEAVPLFVDREWTIIILFFSDETSVEFNQLVGTLSSDALPLLTTGGYVTALKVFFFILFFLIVASIFIIYR